MKKLICMLLLTTMMLSLLSCLDNSDNSSGNASSASDNNSSSSANTDTNSSDDDKNTDPSDEDEDDETPDNEKSNLVACLETLLTGYKWDPKSFIPDKLRPEYEPNLLSSKQTNDYSDFVSVSDIQKNGIGEQWNMVTENLSEAQIFFTVLSAVDNLSTVSVTVFNNYIDDNPADTAHYEFKEGVYSVTIHCTENTIDYVIDYTASIPMLGEQSIQIALSMNTETKVKNVRVQIGDDNALAYTVDQNKYSFAIKYLGIRKAMLELQKKNDGSIVGHIYEYLTVYSLEVASVADFYITDEYVTVVGNKADGMIGFDGYICELYSVSSGRMIGYEVKETLSVAGVDVTYNTLWFDLEDIDGIASVKHIPADSLKEEDKIYINGKASLWETKNFGISGGAKMASRRFDIEFRTQHFYYYDEANEKYEIIKTKVPMLFIQEEVFEDFEDDIKSTNNINASVNVSSAQLDKLMSEYSSKIDLVAENKDKYSVENIVDYIGNKIRF